ncbi:MAG: GatB/YqeY domain-containing protein [Myxococcales bacterium]|nr:GatB/YqeY domain-containing protein [Myxococcales bacterium]
MPLLEQISADLKTSMLARDAARTSAIRMIRAAFIDLEKEGKGAVTDDRCIEALRRLKKQREDSILSYTSANREDLAVIERAELGIIEAYLPQLADEATTLGWVKEAIATSGATSLKESGKVMGALMKLHKADIDGAVARRLIEGQLAGAS